MYNKKIIYNNREFKISIPKEYIDKMGIEKDDFINIKMYGKKILIEKAEVKEK